MENMGKETSKSSRRNLTRIQFIKDSFIQYNNVTICNGIYLVKLNDHIVPDQVIKNIDKGSYDNNNVIVHMDMENNMIQVDVTGITSSKGNDEYDKETGEKIANLKAQRVAFKTIKHIYTDICKEYEKTHIWFKSLELNTEFMVENVNKCLTRYRDMQV